MPQQIPTSIDNSQIDIKTILDPIQVDKSIKHTTWEAYHGSKTPEEFKSYFDKLNLPKEVKHDLWNAKFAPDKYRQELSQRQAQKDSIGQISSVSNPDEMSLKPGNISAFISRYAEALGADLRFGTGQTKAGQIYKKLGGQPFYAGVNPKVADFVLSMPEGILKALEGFGDIGQGKKLQGTGKVISGVSQASEIPLSFMAPEEAELTAKGASKTVEGVAEGGSKIVKGVKQLLNPKSAILPVSTAPRELKMGEMVQKIVKDNISHSVAKLSDAKDELEYVELIIKAKGKADPKLIATYKEAAEKLKEAQELHAAVTKFGSKIAGASSPEQLIMKLAKGGKENQSLARDVIKQLEEHPKAIKNLQDTIIRAIIEKFTGKSLAMGKKTNWVDVQKDLVQKGDMAKDLLGSRYYPILQEVNKLAQQQRLGKAAILSTGVLSILGLTKAWYLRHAMQLIVQ